MTRNTTCIDRLCDTKDHFVKDSAEGGYRISYGLRQSNIAERHTLEA